MKKIISGLIIIFLAAPYIYVGLIYNKLPEKLPMHFKLDGTPDRMGNRSELLLLLFLTTFITLISYYLTAYAYKFDPKKQAVANKENLKKLALAVAFFTTLIMTFAIYSITRGSLKFEVKFVFAAVGLLYTVIGNYMHSIKPNFFAGIRIPWSLSNDENWRKTHLFGGKLWFCGGLLLAAICVALPAKSGHIALLIITALLVIVPVLYSYNLFRHERQSTINH